MAIIEIDWNPSRNTLRVFAILEVLCFGSGAWLLHARYGLSAAAIGVFASAALVAVVGLIKPALLRPVYAVWMAAVFPIGWLVSHLMMLVVFYLVVTPIGLIMRFSGHDPLTQKRASDNGSYWKPRAVRDGTGSYFRQF